MESKLRHTNDEQEVPISQHTGHHDQNEDEHHDEEKKSVFRRFKDKARKLKNTITNQGQGQDHDDVDDDDEEEEEEDETVEAEVHGAPKYDSALGGPDAIVAQPKDNLERPSVIADTKPVASHVPPLTVPAGGAYGTNLSGQSELGGQDVNPEKRESKIGQPTGMENEVTFDPSPTRVSTPVTEHTYENAFDSFENRGQDGTHGGLKSSTGKSTGMMEVPHAPSGLGSGTDPANYDTKATNPTHTEGKEAGLSQVQHSFDKMGIQDSGSECPEHPENLPHDTLAGNQSTGLSGLGSGSGTDSANYETKVTNPTHTEGKEAGLSQVQHSFDKMGIQDSGSERPEHPENLPHDTLAGNQSTGLSGLGSGSGTDSANYETKVTNPTHTEGKEAGLSQVQHSFDKMGIQDSGSERPEHPENLPHDTLAGNQSTGLSGLGSGSGTDSTNYETKVTNPTHTEGKEAGLSQVQHSFDKMGIQDSGSERPEHPENLPHDTLAGNQSTGLSGLGSGLGTDSANYETKVTNPTDTEGKEAGLSQVQHSFDKMGIQYSGSERPEHPENLPHDTLAGNQSTGLSGLGSGSGTDPANYETKVTNPTHPGGKEAGLSQVQHSFDKMAIQDSGSERPEHPENLPHDTHAGNQSTALSGLGSGTDSANYETKVTNPTYTEGTETGLSQVQHSFDKTSIQDSRSECPEHSENLPYDTLAGNQSTGLSGLGSGSGTDSANYETKVTNPTHTGDKEAGLSQVQHSFDKMGIQDSGSEHPEHPENLPHDTLAGNQSTTLSGLGSGSGTDLENYETKVTNSTHTGDKEAGLSQVQHSSDKMGIQDSGSEHEEHLENLPHDTLAGNQSTALSGLGSGSGSGSVKDPENYETKVTNPTLTEGGKEAGLSQVQHSFDKMGIHNSGTERKRFDPEHPDNLPPNTLAGNQSTQNSSYTEKISSIAFAISGKAVVAKDMIASKLGYSGEQRTTTESHENVKNSGSTATDYAHSITDKVKETSAPVNEKVVDAGTQ